MTTEETHGDLIHIGDMHSYRDWEKWARQRDWEWFQVWIEPQWCAWLIAILKQSEDMPELLRSVSGPAFSN